MDKYRFHRQDLVVNGELKDEIAFFERIRNTATRQSLGQYAVKIGKVFVLCQKEKEFREYLNYARNQFEILLESEGYNPETLSKIARGEELHHEALECCLYLGDKGGLEHHLSKLVELMPLQAVKKFTLKDYVYAYLDDEESMACLRNINVKKGWEDVVGVMKDAMVSLMERDVESFRELVIKQCERVKTLKKKGNWHFFSFFNDTMVNLVLIAKMKGMDVKIPHDDIPVFFGGLGEVETYPRINRDKIKKNEFFFEDFRYGLSSDVEKQMKNGEFQIVRGYQSTGFKYSQNYEIYEETPGDPQNALGIRVLKKGNYRFILYSSKTEYFPGEEQPTVSERKILFVVTVGRSRRVIHTLLIQKVEPLSVR